ncbi:MAG: hypothetical protein ACRDGN_05645 [bacterium]
MTAPSYGRSSPTLSTATNYASEATLDDVRIVRPYTISRHLMLTVSNRYTSWKVPLRLDHPAHIPALHEFLLANLGRTIAEIGDLEFHPQPTRPDHSPRGRLRSRRHEEPFAGWLQ